MNILLAADGSEFTKKALAFLVTHENLCGPADKLFVLHVHPPVPPRVKTLLGAAAVHQYHAEEADKVLEPIRQFLDQHGITFESQWKVGGPAEEIIAAGKAHHVDLILMGTHGHGVMGRMLMGSVAQRVVTAAEIPVLLVK